MVVQREDNGEEDTWVAEQEVDVEEGGATLEEKRGRKVGGMKEVGRYNGDDSGAEENDLEDVENAEDMDIDADG